MLSFQECKNKIDDEITNFSFVNHRPIELYEPISYILSLGGKRIRPVLTLMSCQLFTESIDEAINPALAVEIFHNFTLLHDDIMDKAPLRRNHPTVHRKWNDNIAILSGDTMNIIAYQYLCLTSNEIIPELLNVFSKVAIEICEGQQLDMNFESRTEVTIPEYLEMIRLKTAVLLATSLKIGAICGRATENEKQKLYDFGFNLGLAFQIQDDLLDAFGKEEDFGKSIGGDILACKKTFIYLKALELSSTNQKKALESLYTNPNMDDKSKIEQVLNIFNDLKIEAMAAKTVSEYTETAMKALASLNVSKSKDELEKLAYQIMSRKA